ncbi:MAG: hypothetical protein K0U40_07500 [Betaproteobacteria bacterium]|nr:hypothetical protein [Betaproteobacteria bacterium]
MKKLLITLTLILMSTNTMAEWTEMGKSDEAGGYIAYADLTTIRKAGNRVKMWTLIDYKNEQKASGVNFSSKSIRRDYDCQGRHMRILAFKLFSWNMEKGRLVRSYNQPQEWEEVEAESMGETEWKVACGK